MSGETIRLFVGTSANGEDYEAEAVLEYTARKHCTMNLEIVWMRQAADGPYGGWLSVREGRTPFTAYRWSLPSMCGYLGRSIYTDVDFFFRADLAELWNQPIPHVMLVRKPQDKPQRAACILFDCAKAEGHVPDLKALKAMPDAHGYCSEYFRQHRTLMDAFSGDWDCIGFEKDTKRQTTLNDPRIKAVHFSRIESQLHLKHAIPRLKKEGRAHWYTGPVFPHLRQDLQAEFDQLLSEAVAAGYTPDRYRVQSFAGAMRKNFTYSSHVGAA